MPSPLAYPKSMEPISRIPSLVACAGFTLALACSAILAGCGRRSKGPVEITYWTGWSGHEFGIQQRLVDSFNRSHPGIHVRLVSQFGNSGYQKVRIAFAGDATPDLMSTVWADELADYADRGVLTPLDGYLQSSHRDFDKEYVPALRQCLRVDGKVYALAVTTDTSFIVFNKKIFREVGLDPDRPPATPDELFRASKACTTTRSDGGIVRYGFRPTDLRTWAHVFGGDWYDPKAKKITANDPHNVAALRWMCSFNSFLDPHRAEAFQATFGNEKTTSGPFFVGKIAMWETGEWAGEYLRRYGPNVEYGYFPLPAPPGGRPNSSYVNGSVFVIPNACPHKKEAWEFLNWISQPAQVLTFAGTIGNVPPLVSVGFAPRFQNDPLFRFAVKLSHDNTGFGPPGIPMWSTYSSEISRAEEKATIAGEDPQAVLDDLQKRMEREFAETNEDLGR
ncbi:MAG: ABC transporter substrate-binding protein [Fimbriimonas sp.]|nr:ABC transporter substrate-binding protein [Fimbriimonas sp.]